MNETLSSLPAAFPSPRTGKIARLPAAIRQQLHQRLLDNLPAQNILAWLNTLPETRQILRDHFQNNPISPQNLSEWRQGGFRETLLRDELLHHAAGLQESADNLQTIQDPATLADNLAAVLAARYAALLNTWDGEPTPAFEAKIKILHAMTRDVLALQKSLHRTQDLRRQRARQDAEQEALQLEKSKLRALAKLKAPQRIEALSHSHPATAPTIVALETAATLEELHQIQANQTTSTHPTSSPHTPIQPNPTISPIINITPLPPTLSTPLPPQAAIL